MRHRHVTPWHLLLKLNPDEYLCFFARKQITKAACLFSILSSLPGVTYPTRYLELHRRQDEARGSPQLVESYLSMAATTHSVMAVTLTF
jgi:hypothetical protein